MHRGNAQAPSDFGEVFYFFPKNNFILIPSHMGIDTDGQAQATYKSYFGQLSTIRSYWADASYNIAAKTHTDKHFIGLGFLDDKEGEFFNKNRVIGKYAYHMDISSQWHLSGAAALNAINYSFKSSSAGSNGSDIAWSGTLSISLYTSKFKLGIATNDFNSPSVQPVDYKFRLYRFYCLHIEKNQRIGAKTVLTGSMRSNVVPKGVSTAMLHLGISLDERVGVHGFAHNTQGWGWAFDLGKIKLNEGWFDLSFAYKIPYSKGQHLPYNNYEINLAYFFSRKGAE